MERRRYLEQPVHEDLDATMVFVAGPRQVGKTTMARRVLREWGAESYLSWDNREDRAAMRAAHLQGGGADRE